MTTDPCPQCQSASTMLVSPAVPEVIAHRCTACGARWSVPLSVEAAVRLDDEQRHGEH